MKKMIFMLTFVAALCVGCGDVNSSNNTSANTLKPIGVETIEVETILVETTISEDVMNH